MTAQIGNNYVFQGKEYTIVTSTGEPSFHPTDYGITPGWACTACWRGFWCTYNITEDGIYLEDLYVYAEDGHYPEINGKLPEKQSDGEYISYMGHRLYKGLNIKMPFTGKILVGDKFLHEYYIHMGYQHPWAFETLIELIFEDGNLKHAYDQSHIAALIRENAKEDEKFILNLHRKLSVILNVNPGTKEYEGLWWL